MNKTLAVIGTVLALTACSGGGDGGSDAVQSQSSPSPEGGVQGQQPPRGANGLLAAIDGHTLQVQSSSEQTAVTYGDSTTFTTQVATTATAVKAGVCVMVRDSSQPSAFSSAPPTVAPTQASTVTATSVQVSAPVDGACTGFGGSGGRGSFPGGGGPPGGGQFNGTPPAGFTPPAGGFPGGGGLGGGAIGTVVSASANTFAVESTLPGQTDTSQVTVTTTSGTTYTTEKTTTAAALKVGLCVTARGDTDGSGTVAATSIALRAATNGTCTSGPGRG